MHYIFFIKSKYIEAIPNKIKNVKLSRLYKTFNIILFFKIK